MTRLYLVRHAAPAIDPSRPPSDWPLSEEGRRGAQDLAARLAGSGIARCVTSREPKARETGAILAAALGVPADEAPGLHEQERAGRDGAMPFFADRAAFEAAVAEVFGRPGERLFGGESADQAHARFAAALDAVLAAGQGPLAVVSHGTVLALFIARRNRLTPFDLWKSLALPCCAVMSLPDHRLLDILRPRDV